MSLLLALTGGVSKTVDVSWLEIEAGVAGSNFTLTASGGAYAVAGQSAAVKLGKVLTAQGGSYAVAGQQATVKLGKRITANGGAYTLAGAQATVKLGKLLTASGGSYSLTGANATLTKTGGAVSYNITAQGGSYSLTGQQATVKFGKRITASGGAYALAGQQATVKLGKIVVASGGAYTLSGSSANITRTTSGFTLTALGGSYTISGGSASITRTGEIAPGYSAEVELKRWYIKRNKQILIFNTAQEADDYLESLEQAEKAIEAAKKTSRRARQRLRNKLVTVEPIQTVDIDLLSDAVSKFALPEIPQLIEQQDFARFMQILAIAQAIQDEEDDIELLLLA